MKKVILIVTIIVIVATMVIIPVSCSMRSADSINTIYYPTWVEGIDEETGEISRIYTGEYTTKELATICRTMSEQNDCVVNIYHDDDGFIINAY